MKVHEVPNTTQRGGDDNGTTLWVKWGDMKTFMWKEGRVHPVNIGLSHGAESTGACYSLEEAEEFALAILIAIKELKDGL